MKKFLPFLHTVVNQKIPNEKRHEYGRATRSVSHTAPTRPEPQLPSPPRQSRACICLSVDATEAVARGRGRRRRPLPASAFEKLRCGSFRVSPLFTPSSCMQNPLMTVSVFFREFFIYGPRQLLPPPPLAFVLDNVLHSAAAGQKGPAWLVVAARQRASTVRCAMPLLHR